MTLVVDIFRSLLPPRAKTSPSGWTSFNAPCCQHRGHKADTKKRAGVRFETGIVYNCFNCKFSTGWQPGSPIGEKMKSLLRWMGADDDRIKEISFEALKTEAADYQAAPIETQIEFTEKALPEGALSLTEWSKSIEGDQEEYFIKVLNYLINRGYDNPFDHDFYWSPLAGYRDRVIIPFRWENKIVGNTARKVRVGAPKYLSDQPAHYVFNFDKQTEDQKYIFVCEGPFDAMAVDGVGLLTNEISPEQARIINSLGSQIVVIPDQDRPGLMLIDQAVEYGWAVAFPNWDDSVKDCADAVRTYGKLFVTVDAIATAQSGAIKISVAKNHLEQRIERQEHENFD
jgi:hypothetical protein